MHLIITGKRAKVVGEVHLRPNNMIAVVHRDEETVLDYACAFLHIFCTGIDQATGF
jgi:hypothetical protein